MAATDVMNGLVGGGLAGAVAASVSAVVAGAADGAAAGGARAMRWNNNTSGLFLEGWLSLLVMVVGLIRSSRTKMLTMWPKHLRSTMGRQ